MKSLSIWAFAAAVLLTGCANEEITERHDIQGENGRKAITVSTYLPSHTRGYNATQADINSLTQELKEGFLMTAVTDDSVIIDAAHYFVNVDTVPNICFTDDGSTYTWPDEESELKFMAHYPPSAEICQLNVKDRILTASPDGETDVMVADAAFTANSDEGHVQLTFKHLLAHVVFCVKNSEEVQGAKFTLQQISFGAPKTLEYAFGKGTTKVSEEWNPYDLVDGSEGVGISSKFDTIGSVMVSTADTLEHLIKVKYTVVINNDYVNARTYTGTASVKLKAGFVNILNITLSSDKLIMVKSWLNKWGEDTQEIDWYDRGDSGKDANGRTYVDFGLPSGTLWAAWNIDANSPYEVGGRFAWGETETKDEFTIENYKWEMNSVDDPYGYYKDDKLLKLEDDVAYVKWGAGWRMPTMDQIKELFNEEYTTWEWVEGDNPGLRITSKKYPKNSIFFLAAGNDFPSYEPVGYYWGRDVYAGSGQGAASAVIKKAGPDTDEMEGRYFGFPVRAVRSGN